MKKITLYHGSNKVLENPTHSYSKKYLDCGSGFYCCTDKNMAFEYASIYLKNSYVNEYVLECENLNLIDLTSEPFNEMNFLWLMLKFRHIEDDDHSDVKEVISHINKKFSFSLDGVDFIKTYRLNDSYFTKFNELINGSISFDHFCQAIHYSKDNEELILLSKKAMNNLTFIKSYKIPSLTYLKNRQKRDEGMLKDCDNIVEGVFDEPDYFTNLIYK